ncbi:MAG: cysteine--tRNA ligase [Sphaerochaetaceae bacterium]|nr:cysteine--tRNA ligase [Sphaerochaetaceae bacterium]
MKVFLYNTMSRSVEEFKPLSEDYVGMYGCGPTVYNFAHIGNLRTYIFEDVLKRTLVHAGYKVKHVMNITDVGHLTGDGDDGEDKMSKSAREKGLSVWDIAKYYTKAFFDDYDSLNIIRPDVVCPATEHIQQMIELIQRLEKGGHTYIAGGNVYFSIDTLPDYGKLARLNLDDLKSGARIDIDSNKKNPKDFVLWFTNSKFGEQAMMWDSPWGRGYPGWHIECSAMSMYYLGEQFDIHCGGIDAIPVHHTNEIAQSEAATGKKWVNYWMHGEFLLSEKGKMSKSSGEFLTMGVLVNKGYDPLDYRYFCLGATYRTQLQFSYDGMDAARTARLGLVDRISEFGDEVAKASEVSDKAKEYMNQFDGYVCNDLGTARGLSVLWGVLKDEALSNAEKRFVINYMDSVLGLKLSEVKAKKDDNSDIPSEVMELVTKRIEAKKNKDWAAADNYRKQIDEMGYLLKDTPTGPSLQKKM